MIDIDHRQTDKQTGQYTDTILIPQQYFHQKGLKKICNTVTNAFVLWPKCFCFFTTLKLLSKKNSIQLIPH